MYKTFLPAAASFSSVLVYCIYFVCKNFCLLQSNLSTQISPYGLIKPLVGLRKQVIWTCKCSLKTNRMDYFNPYGITQNGGWTRKKWSYGLAFFFKSISRMDLPYRLALSFFFEWTKSPMSRLD